MAYYQVNNHYPNMNHKQVISVTDMGGSTVDVSITTATGYYNWKMELQRYSNGAWRTSGTRDGYVNVGSPSHRTFTNVAQGGQLRVMIYWHGFPGGGSGSTYTPSNGYQRPRQGGSLF